MADFNDIKDATVATIIGEVNTLIQGANEDIQAFANAIVQDSMEAAASGRLDLLPVLEDQAGVLVEKHRIAIAKGAEKVVFDVIHVALSVATKLVIPTIPQL